MLKQIMKRCGFGCFVVVYVMFMLGFFFVLVVFFDIIVMYGFVDELVEFCQILYFDYREVMVLLIILCEIFIYSMDVYL